MASNIQNKYVTFKLGKEYYGLPIENVISIEKPSKQQEFQMHQIML